MTTRAQKEVYGGKGVTYEKRGVRWLKKRGFRIIKSFPGPHNDYYDAIAKRKGKKWIVEIKGGKEPTVNIDNLLEMYSTQGVNKLGLLFVLEKEPHLLFELNKMSLAGLKASTTKSDH